MSIIAAVIENLSSLVPFRYTIVHSYETGVKFRFGKDINRCSVKTGARFPTIHNYWPYLRWSARTGFHFYWAFESIEVLPCVEQPMDTAYQTVTLKDGKELTVNLAINFTIKNCRKYFVRVHEFSESMENVCQQVVSSTLRELTYDKFIQQGQQDLEELLWEELEEKLFEWGVILNSLTLVNVSKSRSFRLLKDIEDTGDDM